MAKNTEAKRLKITLIRSTIGFNKTQAATVQGLGWRSYAMALRAIVEIAREAKPKG